MLKNTKRISTIKPKYSREEISLLKQSREDKDIIILRVDKGNATVIMSTKEYSD